MNTIILERLCQEFPDFLDQFDLFTGCSNGAMVLLSVSIIVAFIIMFLVCAIKRCRSQ